MTTEQTESVMLTQAPEQVWRRKKVKKARKARKACKGRRRLPSWGAIMNEPTPYKLIKVSDPGWEKDFVSKQEATAELLKHICSECREDSPTPDPDDIYALARVHQKSTTAILEEWELTTMVADEARLRCETASKMRYEIREDEDRNFDVYDLRPPEKRWLATFRMFEDAKSFINNRSLSHERYKVSYHRAARLNCRDEGA